MATVTTRMPSTVTQFIPPTTKRTNSLGWAKSDCHTCSSSARRCDRRRPRCDACTVQGIVCGGFAQKLKWDAKGQKQAPNDQVVLKEAASPAGDVGVSKPASFTFVQETVKLKRKPDRPRKTPERRRSEDLDSGLGLDEAEETALATRYAKRRRSEPDPDAAVTLYHFDPNFFQLPAEIREQISFFTWSFSPMTLTWDVQVNPWQACLPQAYQLPFILDAVVALAKRHRAHMDFEKEDVSVLELKDRALTEFAASVGRVPCETAISISLLLIGLEYADTGFSHWSVHLSGAYRILESGGGIKLAEGNTNLRSQVAQLIWYDTNVALVSRTGPIFPRTYSEHLIAWQKDTEWSLLGLNGYPDGAFLTMYDIADTAAHMDELEDGHVARLEMGLWLAQFNDTGDKNITSLKECWRLAMLLYCTRVFHQNEDVRKKARTFAEEILWLVHDMNADSQAQKQCVFPVFLAACEMDSFRFRSIATEFSKRWKNRTGIWMIQTAADLWEKVWEAADENPEQDVWWGDIVESGSSGQSYLMG